MTKSLTLALTLAILALTASARFVDAKSEMRKSVEVDCVTVSGKAPSKLPEEKKWKLVWNDEFDGKEIDRTKWMCRESFWGHDFPAFSHNFEGVEMTGETVKLNLVRKGNDFVSPHLQTGSLTYDVPRDTAGFWPFGKYRRPLFMKKYGYFEIRCRQPKYKGWHSAFWLQAPGIGSTSNPATCGIETDIMENYRQFIDGYMVGGNGFNGYGNDSCWFDHFKYKHEETADGWHYYGCDWSPEGYAFYCDGKKVGEQNWPVSHVEQFVLVSTEVGGYRKAAGNDGGLTEGRNKLVWGKPVPEIFEAKLPEFFEVDFVRVYDEVVEPGKPRPISGADLLPVLEKQKAAFAAMGAAAKAKMVSELLAQATAAKFADAVEAASVHAPLWKLTNDAKWFKLYDKERDEAGDLANVPAVYSADEIAALRPRLAARIAALEGILMVEDSDKFRAKFISGLVIAKRLEK